MVSMKDIASSCGVSIATVSKALNNQSDISEATKKIVRRKAQELGYFPNASARALKTNRTYNIGALFVDRARNGLTHDYFARVLDGFKVAAEECGYDLTFINCSDSLRQKMTYLEHSRSRGVDGVVVAHIDFEQDDVAELLKSDLPVVTIDTSFDYKPSVVSDNVKGMRDLVSYIAGRGHTKIAYINGGDRSTPTRNRMVSFYSTMEELGIPVREEYMIAGDYRNPVRCAELTRELLALPDPPTCIIYPDDLAALGGLNVFRERGLSVPDDISMAGYDGIDVAKYLEPQITTIEQNAALIGEKAAEKLISLIEKPKTTLVERAVVEGRLLPGGSVKDLTAGDRA